MRVLRKAAAVRAMAVAVSAVLFVALACGTTVAAPEKPSAIASINKDGRTWHLLVYSAAMHKDVKVDVQRPVDESKPAPNLYMLNGLDAGQGSANWKARTHALDFLAGKQVNVVQPIGGYGSYYTDWQKSDPVLGLNMWKTFFTEELPPLLDRTLKSTGVNALTGLSTSGTSVLQLAEAKPGLWKTVAAYSGCAQIADPMGQEFVKLVVEGRGGGSTLNMYGPANGPLWAQNDPVINAEKLRGTSLYISTGNGIPLPSDVQLYFGSAPGLIGGINMLTGMVIEAAVDQCTHNLMSRLNNLNIPATYQFNSVGVHNWPYWEDALHNSWPMLAQGMKIPA